MANITLSVPDATYRQARVYAAREGTSVSALVRGYLVSLTQKEVEHRRLAALQSEVLAEIRDFSAAGRLTREDVHERALR